MSSLPSDITVPGRPRCSRCPPGSTPTSSRTAPGGSTTPASWPARRASVSIDACATERRTRAYARAIAAVTPAPVRTVVNTHHHGDHTFGNCLFPGAAIVAHERARAEAIAFGPPAAMPFWDGPDWGELSLDPPFVTFTDEITLHSGDLRAQVRHVGTAAHTTNDSIVWIPERSVLFCGDLIFNGGTPFLLMGSVARCRRGAGAGHAAARRGRSSCPATARSSTAPGPSTRRWTTSGSCSTSRAGPGPPGCPAGGGPGHRPGPVRGLAGRRADRRQPAPGLRRAAPAPRAAAPIDIVAALGDMVAYNGGAPLTCLA